MSSETKESYDYFGLETLNTTPSMARTISSKSEEWNRRSSASETSEPVVKPEKKEFVTIKFPDGREVSLPLISPTLGPKAIDVRGLLAKAGVFTYDPGFTSTCSCSSEITYIDGPEGLLMHRGYDIGELVAKSDFVEATYLILYGELPSPLQKQIHEKEMKSHRQIHEKLIKFFDGFKADAHPMAVMVAVVGALSSFYESTLDIDNPAHRALAAYRMISKVPVLAAMAYKRSIGEPFVYPKHSLSFAENLLYMLFAKPSEPYTLVPAVVKAVETFLILHMDHEQNASTSTVRIAGSSKANPYACIAAGIATLWGPSHGGANEAVLRMLAEIGSVDRIPMFLAKAKDKKDPFRLMGFGHRVYKNYDPRAKQMQGVCYEVLEALGKTKEPLLGLAMELEKQALADDYFQKRKLFPNVDFYSGIVLRAIGFPLSMFTVMFAVSRTVGWVSQWKEMSSDPNFRIGRPRQVYTGKSRRAYVPLVDRLEVVTDPDTVAMCKNENAPPVGKVVEVVIAK